MAAPGHPNSAQPVVPDGRGGYNSVGYDAGDDEDGLGGDVAVSDAEEPIDCPTCGGKGKVVRRVVTENDVAARQVAAQSAQHAAAYGALTGAATFSPMPRS